jgi:hypothetical protein
VRQHDGLGTAVAAGGEQLERAAAVGASDGEGGVAASAGGLLGPGGKATRFPHWVAYS